MTSNNVSFPCRWGDLPDPRANGITNLSKVVIEFHESDWRKVVGKHFANCKEPWKDTIPLNVLQTLVASEGVGSGAGLEINIGLALINKQIKECLNRPLVMLYSCVSQQFRGQGRRWVLLLPNGAVSIVWVEKTIIRLKTCYFTGSVAVKPKEGRWRHTLRQLVQEYATYNESTSRFVYPDKSKLLNVSILGTPTEIRYAIQFAKPKWWGFASFKPSEFASSKPYEPWQPPIWSWPVVQE